MFRFIFSGKLHPTIVQKAVKAAATAISEHEQKLMELCTLPAIGHGDRQKKTNRLKPSRI